MIKLNVLIVEDNSIIALDLKKILIRNKINVVGIATNTRETFKIIENKVIDIILMDINLQENENGIDLVKKIHKRIYIPIIYITGNEKNVLIDFAIETRPIAYLLKPFRETELISTIKLFSFNYPNKVDINNQYSFNLLNKYLYYENEVVKLTSKEQIFISLLVNAKGNAISFIEIENELWLNEVVSNDALRVLIYRLRKKLKYDLIETVYGFGFKLNFQTITPKKLGSVC